MDIFVKKLLQLVRNGNNVKVITYSKDPNCHVVTATPIDKSLLTRAYLPSRRGLTGSLSAASMSFSQL